MAVEDFLDAEVGIAVAATAMLASPQVRAYVRRGLVLGLAGVFKAGDAMGSAAKGVAAGAQNTVAAGAAAAKDTTTQAKTTARGSKTPPATQGE